MTSSTPFAPGSISLRLYPHDELDAAGIVRELCDQARLGLSGGFDGVMTSEHHGGFAGYLPNPLQIASSSLEETASGWVAPCPLLLALRPVAQLAEEVAWLGARHPGRVGLGVAAGALPLDFAAMEVALADAVPLFKARLPRIVEMLHGRDLRELEGDRALRECGTSPIPVLSAAVSTTAARRAAACGAGILTEGMSSAPALRRICEAYIGAGGAQPTVTIRRVWVGEPRSELIGRQRAVYDSYAGARPSPTIKRSPLDSPSNWSSVSTTPGVPRAPMPSIYASTCPGSFPMRSAGRSPSWPSTSSPCSGPGRHTGTQPWGPVPRP